ncbi:MAG: hypothetical protein CMC82_01860 [Flavobacteriaceae bacterium]|nr:hypothetical protein [Flavobacteriaceae bacterium]
MKKCLICEGFVKEQSIFKTLPRVTSDCKPFPVGGTLSVCKTCSLVQKYNDSKWNNEIKSIYKNYTIYSLANGSEQLIFTDDGAFPRSQKLVDYFLNTVSVPSEGELIDLGCGNGAALNNFSKRLEKWKFDGFELDDRNLFSYKKILNFRDLICSNNDLIPSKYDIISAIHSLEHVPNPIQFLENIHKIAKPNCKILIQVPNMMTSTFDVLVADHLTHFTPETLTFLIEKTGFEVISFSDKILPKEITMIIKKAKKTRVSDMKTKINLDNFIKDQLEWLQDLIIKAEEYSNNVEKFGVFGTSISAMWIYGKIGKNIKFFVDEDPTKVGKNVDDINILHPNDVPNNSQILVPLTPEIRSKIINRLSGEGTIYF